MHLVVTDEALHGQHADVAQVAYLQVEVAHHKGGEVVACHLEEQLVLVQRSLGVGQHEGELAQAVSLQRVGRGGAVR